jgi:hypothetical protein
MEATMRARFVQTACLLLLLRLAGCGPPEGAPPRLPDLRATGKADESGDARGARYLVTRDPAGRPTKVRIAPDAPRAPASLRQLAVDAAPALDFLRRNQTTLALSSAELEALRPAGLTEDEGSVAVTLEQTFAGHPVLDAGVRVVFRRDGELEVVHLQQARALAPGAPAAMTAAAAADLARRAAGGALPTRPPEVRAVWVAATPAARAAYEVTLTGGDPPASWRYVLDARSGEILSAKPLRTDLAGRGRVWPHNAWVDARTALRALPRLDDGAHLHGRYVEVRDGLGEPAAGVDGRFDFPAGDRRFGEVMAYAHGDALAAYLDALGFPTRRQPLVVTVHAFDDLNAYFDAGTGGLYFGAVAGFRVADDADVIAHELGHAVVDGQAPDLIAGDDGDAAIHEGYADYLACSFADDPYMGEAFWEEVARAGDAEGLARMGFDPRHPGRRCDAPRSWPDDADDDPHLTGMILAGALWDLRAAARRDLGRDDGVRATDRVALAALKYLAPRHNQPRDVLDAVLQADRQLRLGLGEAAVTAFATHGIRTTR